MIGKEYKYIKGIFERKINVTLSIMITFLLTGAISFAMTAEEFRTDEYYYMGGEKGKGNSPLDAIKAAEAYAQGYTGKGVTLGIVDEYVNLSHREFLNKDNSYIIGEIPEDMNWKDNTHGSHVAGIMSASKDGYGMHGVAFNSNFVSGNWVSINGKTENENIIEAYNYFNTREDIKVINNSWGEGIYIDELHNIDKDSQGRKGLLKILSDELTNVLKKSMKSYNKLLIFANGNFGHLTPDLYPLLSYLDKDVKNNIIGITLLNAEEKKDNPKFLTVFSDLNKYNEENSISAPGTWIISVDADSKEGYREDSGTSMAAPMVTGTGGLVQEAFPYMTGKQIGDVLLSTADKNFSEKQKFVVTIQEDDGKQPVLNMIYFGNKPTSKGKLEEDVKEYYDANKGMLKLFYNYTLTEKEFIEHYLNGSLTHIYENVPHEIVYGQGVLDAGKAVRGLGTLNARRLESSDKSSNNVRVKGYLSGDKVQALYTINTRGYDSTWSNNITETRVGYMTMANVGDLETFITKLKGGEVKNTEENKGFEITAEEEEALKEYIDLNKNLSDKEKKYFDEMFKFYLSNEYMYNSQTGGIVEVEDNDILLSNGKEYIDEYNKRVAESGLVGLSVGLMKEGAGTLALTGENTYTGASIAGGGTLQIDGSIVGEAYSLGDEFGIGTIAGKGTIERDLYNYGKVQAGSWGEIGTLTVNGKFESSGAIVVNVDGKENSTLSVGSIGNITGTTIEINGIAIPEHTYSGFLVSGTEKEDVENLTGRLSLFLGYDVEKSLTKSAATNYDLVVNKTAGLDSLSGMSSSQRTSSRLLENMYSALSGKFEQRELDILYNIEDEGTALRAFQETYGGLQSDMVHNLPLNTRINSSIYSRLSDSDMVLDKAENSVISLDKNMWIKVLNGWKDINSSRGMSAIDIDMKGFILGNDYQLNGNYKGGYYLAYGENDIKSGNDKGEIKDFRTGLYGNYEKNRFNVNSYLGLGLQRNESERNLSVLDSKAKGKYDSWTFEAGAKLRYALDNNLYPYGEVNIIRYENEDFREKGAGVYSQRFEKSKNIYTTAGLGIEKIKDFKTGRGTITLGYERILTGNDPDMRVSFAGNESNKFKVKGHEEDRDYLVMKVKGEKIFENGVSIYGELEGRVSENTRDIRTSLGAGYRF